MTEADSNDITEHPHDDRPRPYVCTVCDKRFTRKDHLTNHRNKHTGKNLYSCSQCEKRFLSLEFSTKAYTTACTTVQAVIF